MRVRCHILKSSLGDSSNSGISSKHDAVMLTDEENPPVEINGTPVVKLVRRKLHETGEYLHAEPVESMPVGHVGYMAGGCYIMGSTSGGFPNEYPIGLFDRCESKELYASMD